MTRIIRMIDLILAKRHGKEHTQDEIKFLIDGIMDNTIPDYQLSSWLMATCWQGLSNQETSWLTDFMSKSGETLDLTDIADLVGDKHSTGGVGDKTTLVFVPLMQAAGIPMAKLSGRGLGHTGGTIDKLEAIPGFNTQLTKEEFISQIKKIGMAIAGQTKELAPADGKIYALRDVTGTVESIPLIASSVMSKKLAAGANLIILDVKCGKAAFMDTLDKAENLARQMVEIGKALKKVVIATVTEMEQPLGLAVGHTTECIEAFETLKGRGPEDLRELCMELGAVALVKAKKAENKEKATRMLSDFMDNGIALEKCKELISAQGGNPKTVDDYGLMPQAKHKFALYSPHEKPVWISHLDGKTIAEGCKMMGAGRTKKDDKINLGVGVILKGKIGTRVEKGEPVAEVWADSREQFELVQEKILSAFTFNDTEVETQSLIKATVS